MKTPLLETERLILKRGKLDDYIKVYEYDFTRLRNINGEFEYVKLNKDDLIGFDTYADREELCMDFIIYLKENNEPIGNIVYDRYDEKTNSLEVSYNLHPNYWKKGYMKEAVLETMKYIFDNYEFDNIRCGYAEENSNSRLLNEKIGFEYFNEHITYYKRIDKNIREIEMIMSREKFNSLYKKINSILK